MMHLLYKIPLQTSECSGLYFPNEGTIMLGIKMLGCMWPLCRKDSELFETAIK